MAKSNLTLTLDQRAMLERLRQDVRLMGPRHFRSKHGIRETVPLGPSPHLQAVQFTWAGAERGDFNHHVDVSLALIAVFPRKVRGQPGKNQMAWAVGGICLDTGVWKEFNAGKCLDIRSEYLGVTVLGEGGS